MVKVLFLIPVVLILSGCGESDAVKEWQRCSYEVSKLPYDPDAQIEAQAYCDSVYESSIAPNQ